MISEFSSKWSISTCSYTLSYILRKQKNFMHCNSKYGEKIIFLLQILMCNCTKHFKLSWTLNLFISVIKWKSIPVRFQSDTLQIFLSGIMREKNMSCKLLSQTKSLDFLPLVVSLNFESSDNERSRVSC